ncbi:MAG: PLDc N-terminal domain-containing protein [Chthoniobacteraceae bacterium]
MFDLLHRFSFSTASWSLEVGLGVLLLWVAIVACAISSIRAQDFTNGQRRFWAVVVICLPIIGLLAYLPFSIPRDDEPRASLYAPRKNRAARRTSAKQRP